jgi:hypothetical protein
MVRLARLSAGYSLAWLLSAAVVFAQQPAKQPAGPPEMSPEMKKMMEAYEKAGAPGKEHQWLATKAGTWDFEGKFWMDPAAPPMEAKGTSERTTQLGGRVLAEKVTSAGFMGQPFEGHGMTGYDNTTGEYWSTWNDSMSTGLMLSKGSCDDKKVCTFKGEFKDPATGSMKTMRSVMREEGPDKEVHEAFETTEGKEVKTMELTYTRKK